MSEILPTSIRAFGVATGYQTFNAIVVLLVQVSPMALESISWRYFLIFLILDVVFIIGFYFMVPETKKKTLEEIEALFGDEVAETLEEAGKHAEDQGVAIHTEEIKEKDTGSSTGFNNTENHSRV
jgi:(p)ppGpp synthase/HD superfamily hydrolase